MKSKFFKFFCSTTISLVLLFGTMVFTSSCEDDNDEDCPNVAVNIGKFSSGQCEDACEDAGYQNYFVDNSNCCCWN